jgi:hypothetical protein
MMGHTILMLVVWSVVFATDGSVAMAQQVGASAESDRAKPTDWPQLREKRELLLKEIADQERESRDADQLGDRVGVLESSVRQKQDEVADAERRRAAAADIQRLKVFADDLARDLNKTKNKYDKARLAEQTLKAKREELGRLDARIGTLLSPEVLGQSFKTWMSFVFAGLVLGVMVGFFFIAWKDETIRRTIFGGAAGIQFVTLFSLVIAIILFGITGILEGRELSALLGGLSGYILGRGTGRSATGSQARSDGIAAGGDEQAQGAQGRGGVG